MKETPSISKHVCKCMDVDLQVCRFISMNINEYIFITVG